MLNLTIADVIEFGSLVRRVAPRERELLLRVAQGIPSRDLERIAATAGDPIDTVASERTSDVETAIAHDKALEQAYVRGYRRGLDDGKANAA